MKYEEYRRKKWRRRIKFDRRNQVNIEEKVLEMRQTFGHLCFECQFKRDCPLRKGGTTVLLICPHFLQKEMEEKHHERFVSRCQAGSSGTRYQSYGSGLSQILCKHRNAVQIEQNLFKAEVAQAAAALFSK